MTDNKSNEIIDGIRLLATICMYVIGGFFAFAGVCGILLGEVVVGGIMFTMGMIAIPYVRTFVADKTGTKRINGVVAIVISFMLLFVFAVVVPTPEYQPTETSAPKATPIITPNPTPIPTHPPIETTMKLDIGDTAIMDRSEVTLLSAYSGRYIWEGASGTSYYENAESGNTFVMLKVNIKSTDHETTYSKSNFYMIDNANYRYDPIRYRGEHDLKRAELAIGQQTQGIIAFEIPEGSRGVELIYECGTSDSWVWHYETSSWLIVGIERLY